VSSKHQNYVVFCQEIRKERGYRCQCCKRTAEEAREKKLHIHHLWPVAASGINDALVTARVNVILICSWCHKLQHPGMRRYLWDMASNMRSKALRR
jgi:predicted HNH restriction endonuclease